MKDKELNLTLREKADALNVCDKFRSEWNDDFGRQDLVNFYKRGIEFCIDNSFPSNDFIKKNFDQDMLRKSKVFVDDNFGEVNGGNGVYICNGKSSGTLHFGDMDVATIYVRHDCRVNIVAEGISKVFVDVLDKASANVIQQESSAVYVYKRGTGANVTVEGNVRVRERG